MNYTLRNKYKVIDITYKLITDVKFNNCDFRRFFKSLAINKNEITPINSFIYNDSPYLNTVDTYKDSDEWIKQDAIDLFDCLQKTGCKFAYSEFNHPFILDQAKERNLNIITIGERENLKNRRIEILITNYIDKQLKFF